MKALSLHSGVKGVSCSTRGGLVESQVESGQHSLKAHLRTVLGTCLASLMGLTSVNLLTSSARLICDCLLISDK